MTIQTEREAGRPSLPSVTPSLSGANTVYTRYCAAPRPSRWIGEPRFVHALLVAAWLGRLFDPLPQTKHARHAV